MPGIYIHIPFCKQACSYCNFHFSTLIKYREPVLRALAAEIHLRKNYLDEKGNVPQVSSIYFGGGTPSLLSGGELGKLLSDVYRDFRVAPDAEITLEANADDLDEKKFSELQAAGVNRLSIGVQSFFDEDLRLLKRIHSGDQAYRAVAGALAAGFENLSVDLIYGIPSLSHERWEQNLMKVISLGIPHLSCYALTVEPKTELSYRVKKNKAELPGDEHTAQQFTMLMQLAKEKKYLHYEISNFCLEGHYARHNSSYWKREHYLGIGPSAHSYNGRSRQWNVAGNMTYVRSIEKGIIPCEKEELTSRQKYNEYIMTSLRTMWGCSPAFIRENYGSNIFNTFIAEVKKISGSGMLSEKDDTFFLTEKGKLFADKIISDLFQLHEN